ncbi:hypothetical protein N7451_008483 [Penicillium sp. IBT 35674x]|nr:hypothetical protein N7451_008483 [Penicillium sp. IBT 35674x]
MFCQRRGDIDYYRSASLSRHCVLVSEPPPEYFIPSTSGALRKVKFLSLLHLPDYIKAGSPVAVLARRSPPVLEPQVAKRVLNTSQDLVLNTSTRMWIVAALPATKNSIFMLSATHRGYMYPVRAAIIAQIRVDKKVARYLYIHDCPNVPNDLMEYLKAIAQKLRIPYFFVSYGRENVQASARPPRDGRCTLGVSQEGAGYKETILDLNNDGSLAFRHISFITEGYATLRKADVVSTDESRAIWNGVNADMTIVQGSEDVLHQMFGNANTHLFGQWPKPNSDQKTILVLHRDSGKGKDGPYPEYDTGEALAQIISQSFT